MNSNVRVDVVRARTLKDRCYAAWHSEPVEAALCASELAELARASRCTGSAVEIEALWRWTAGIASIVSGDLDEAVGHLDCARDRFGSLGLLDDAAQTQVPRIMALALLGRFEEAERCARAARDEFLAQNDFRSAAKVVLNLGSLCYSLDQYVQAAEHYTLASVWFARVGDLEHSVLADVGRGDACSFLGDLDEAEALYRRAAHRAKAHGLHVIHASTTQALAELGLVRGRYREALSGLESASRCFADLGMPMLQNQAERALAETYLELNLHREAAAMFTTVARNVESDSAAAAWTDVQIARLALRQNDVCAAENALLRAQRLFLAMRSEVGTAEVALTLSAARMIDKNWSAAHAEADAALVTLRRLELPHAHASLAVASAEVRLGEYEAAERRAETLAGDPAVVLPVRESALLWLGRARLGHGDRAGAKRAFEQAVELAEAGVAGLPSDDVQCGYLDARAGAYEHLLAMALEESDQRPDSRRAENVFAALERLRARTLLFRLGARAAADTPELRQQVPSDDRQRLDWLYRRTNRQLREPECDSEAVSLLLVAERQALEHRLLEQLRRQRMARPEIMASSGPPTVPPDALTEPQAAGSGLVSYGLLDDEVFAVTWNHGVCRVHRRLADRAALDAAIRALHNQLMTQRLGDQNLSRHQPLLLQRARQCLGKLYDHLWRPLEPALTDATCVRIAPTGALATVPFAALWDGRQYLVENVSVSYLLRATGVSRPPVSLVPDRVTLMADTIRLAGSRSELEGLLSVWPLAHRVDGAELTRSRLESCVRETDLLHIAAHGEFRPDNPLFSALQLADDALFALDVEQLPLRPGAIVVLSGCETALSDAGRRDEALGLVRAFLVAGAGSVVAGLWQVDDASTAEWMVAMHRRLRDVTDVMDTTDADTGQPRDRAVLARVIGDVQKRYILDGLHPYHWAAFTVHDRA